MTCSDSSGYVVDEKGIDLDLLKQIKEVERGRVATYADARGTCARLSPGGRVWDVPCDVALPSATQNELDLQRTRDPRPNGVRRGRRGRQHAHHPRRASRCSGSGRRLRPRQGRQRRWCRHVSALEMPQNAARDTWSFAAERPQLLASCATSTTPAADRRRVRRPGDYVPGANIAGFQRVADAMLAQGVI